MEHAKLDQLSAILADVEAFRSRWQNVSSQSDRGFYRANCFAPKVSYGRHRGPAPRSSYPAAVLMAFLPTGELTCGKPQWSIPLTLRPTNMSDHAGQVSFPGGRCQQGETAQQAACREYTEELGCSSDSMELIGSMPSLYVYASHHQVVPVLSVGDELPDIRPNVHEVEKVLWLPFEQLMQLKPQARTIQRNAIQYEASGFWIEGHWVWGATAMMLEALKLRLERLA